MTTTASPDRTSAPGATADRAGGVAHRLEAALRPFVGGDLPVRLRAWDGSEAGPLDAPLVELRSPDAVRRLLWHPGELGAAQAYVTGEIEVAPRPRRRAHPRLAVAAERGLSGVRPSPGAFVRALRTARRRRRRRHAAAPARLPGPGARAGCTASCATGARSATTTTCPTSSTR